MIQEDVNYINELCDEFGINIHTYTPKIKKGPYNIKSHIFPIHYFTDHLGYRYKTLLEMCDAYKISIETYHKRKDKKMPLEKILTTREPHKSVMPKTDHTGQTFEKFIDMCTAWGTTPNHVRHCLKKGQSLQEALTAHPNAPIVDHLGITYFGEKAMLRAYRIYDTSWPYSPSYESYVEKRKNGVSLGEALIKDTLVERMIPNEVCLISDHKGKCYNNLEEMCQAYGTTVQRYLTLIYNRYSLKEALTEPDTVTNELPNIAIGTFVHIENDPQQYKVLTYPYKAIGTMVIGLEGFGPCPVEKIIIPK